MSDKKCKYCAMMISSDAKICPHCRKKQSSSFGGLFIAGTCFTLLIILSRACSEDNTQSTPAIPTPVVHLTEKGKKVKAKHTSWKNEVCNAIGAKKIFIGMNQDQVKAAWGKPYKINSSTGSYGVHEQWVMSEGFGGDYLYFQNGVLTSMQQSSN